MNLKIKKENLILFSLAICAFAIGLTEFISVGIIPLLQKNFNINFSLAGLTVSLYAIGVLFGAPILTILTSKIPRKKLLIIIMITFILGNIISMIAGTFLILLIGRIISALAHGIFMSIASIIAASVVKPIKRASAISMMFTGLTLATIIGVPIGSFIGFRFGWRISFLFIVIIGIISLIINYLTVPGNLIQPAKIKSGFILRIFKTRKIIIALIITVLGYGSSFPVYTYLTIILNKNMNWSENSIIFILIIYGVMVAIGNIIGGHITNKKISLRLLWIFIANLLVLIGLIFTFNNHLFGLLNIFLLGLVAFMNVPGLQLYIIKLGEKIVPEDIQMVSALNISAFNLGITIGSFAGGKIADNLSLVFTPYAGIGMLIITIILMLILNIKSEKK